jgi:hypothetical protein
MGGQIGRNCLTVEEMFIIGQMIRECIPAESRAGHPPLTSQAQKQSGAVRLSLAKS